jgi:hypothetical protein
MQRLSSRGTGSKAVGSKHEGLPLEEEEQEEEETYDSH